LGRRRRRVIKVVKKKLPTVFACPSCGEESIRVKLPQTAGPAIVQCGSCGLKQEFEATPSSQIVDIYCKFTDAFYSKEKPPAEKAEQPASPTSTNP
jgi:transcription elongation factor Elf1